MPTYYFSVSYEKHDELSTYPTHQSALKKMFIAQLEEHSRGLVSP